MHRTSFGKSSSESQEEGDLYRQIHQGLGASFRKVSLLVVFFQSNRKRCVGKCGKGRLKLEERRVGIYHPREGREHRFCVVGLVLVS